MEAVFQDLRYAARRLLRAPGFTITAVLTLAIGIGAVTSVFSLVDGVLLRSLPFPDADRLMWVQDHGTAPLGLYELAKGDRGSIETTAAYSNALQVLSGLGPAEWVEAPSVTASLFPLLGARPALGRLIESNEDRTGSAPVAVLSHAFWLKRFGGDSAVLGRTIRLNSTDYRIVGVASPGLQLPERTDLWCNLGPSLSGPNGASLAKGHQWWILARLRPGISPIRAGTELRALALAPGSLYPTASTDGIGLQPLHEFLVDEFRTGLWILLGAVALLLLTAATNVASLLVSRIADRDRELSVRTALGARRSRLASMVLAESLLVSVAGGAGGLFVADAGFKSLLLFVGRDLPEIVDIRISVPVLVFAIAVSLVTGLVAGVAPAILAARRDPVQGIKGYTQGRRTRRRPGDALVIAQVALTVVLLSGAGLLGHSFWRLVTLDPGYRSKDVVSVRMLLPRYPTGASRRVYAARVLERLRILPGVTAAAVSTSVPGVSGELSFNVANPAHPGVNQLTVITESSPNYPEVLGIPLRRGRWARDEGSAVISETGARVYFPGEDPLGKVLTDEGRPDVTIVGVAGDTRQLGLNQDPPPELYLPLPDQWAFQPNFVVRTSGPADAMVTPLRHALEEVDPNTPVYEIAPVSAMVAKSLATQRSYAIALGGFALGALALAAIGIYGLVATGVARRTREIGIRIALGAERENVMGLVLGRGVLLAGIGLVIGLGGSVLGARVLKSMLFQVGAGDPLVLAAVVVVLFAATLAATYFPARRAAAVDPLVALRTE